MRRELAKAWRGLPGLEFPKREDRGVAQTMVRRVESGDQRIDSLGSPKPAKGPRCGGRVVGILECVDQVRDVAVLLRLFDTPVALPPLEACRFVASRHRP